MSLGWKRKEQGPHEDIEVMHPNWQLLRFVFILVLILIVAGSLTGLFIAKDAPNFGVVQGIVGIVVVAFIALVLAFWPSRSARRLDDLNKSQ